MEYFETIVNIETGETTIRPFTDSEIKAAKELAKKADLDTAQSQVKASAKAALLTKLGITAEEAALLIG